MASSTGRRANRRPSAFGRRFGSTRECTPAGRCILARLVRRDGFRWRPGGDSSGLGAYKRPAGALACSTRPTTSGEIIAPTARGPTPGSAPSAAARQLRLRRRPSLNPSARGLSEQRDFVTKKQSRDRTKKPRERYAKAALAQPLSFDDVPSAAFGPKPASPNEADK